MLNLDKYECIIFDCDGVLLQSNEAKAHAFRHALSGADNALIERFVDYHHEHGGVSRHIKLTMFHRDWEKAADWQERVTRSLARFSEAAMSVLLSCPEVPGARLLVEQLAAKGTPLFVVSGADEGELRELLAQRGLSKYFKQILGGPTEKQELLRRLDGTGDIIRPALFFGDSRTDMEAATSSELDFIFVSGHTGWTDGATVCQQRGIPVITDFLKVTG